MNERKVITTITDDKARAEMLKAMDIIIRNLNDERIIFGWLEDGVPDGTYENNEYEEYVDDDVYDDIVDDFVYYMRMALNHSK